MAKATFSFDDKVARAFLHKLQQRFERSTPRNKKRFAQAIDAVVSAEFIRNFENEGGPKKFGGSRTKWKKWSDATKIMHERRKKKGLPVPERILQDRGDLRKSIMPTKTSPRKRYKIKRVGILFKSEVPYSRIHDLGGPMKAFGKWPTIMPQRKFMQVSRQGKELIGKAAIGYLLGKKRLTGIK